jgi:hypothetical protein
MDNHRVESGYWRLRVTIEVWSLVSEVKFQD